MRQIATLIAIALLAGCASIQPAAAPAAPSGIATLAEANYNPNNFDTAKIMDVIINPKSDLVLLASHRGNHALIDGKYPKVPENSFEAIGLAAITGLEQVELDVKLTKDGIPILSHDMTWGREACVDRNNYSVFDPFRGDDLENRIANLVISERTLSDIRSYPSNIRLRDTVSIIKEGAFNSCYYLGDYEVPHTLAETLTFIRDKKIAMVLSLDIRDAATAAASWEVIGRAQDHLGRSFARSTLFKIPAKAFSSPRAVEDTFRFISESGGAHFQPVYNTADIAPDVYGSEENIIRSLQAFENYNSQYFRVTAVEIQIKKIGGILTSVLNAARTNSKTGAPMSVTVFSPYADYYGPGDPSRSNPLFFRTDGYCCVSLSDFYYNGQPNGQPSDDADNRGSVPYLLAQGFNAITTDNAISYHTQLEGVGKRNISYMQASPATISALRVMPLGASLTEGVGSSDSNGYRSELYEGLRSLMGVSFDFAGRKKGGTMSDPDHEGYSGFRIDQIAGEAKCAVPYYKPNLVTIIAGTNDMIQNSDVGRAPERLGQLVDQILTDSPKATVLVSVLPPITSGGTPGANDRARAYNAALPVTISRLQAEGKQVRLVDPAFTNADVGPDGIHLTDGGYDKLGRAFLGGAKGAAMSNWLRGLDPEGTLPSGCPGESLAGDSRWTDHGVIFPNGFAATDNFRFGDVNGDKKPEFFVIHPDKSFDYYWNGGFTSNPDGWAAWGKGSPHGPWTPGVASHTMRFPDFDGDGLADCVSFDGNGRIPKVGFFSLEQPIGKRLCAYEGQLNWTPEGVGTLGDGGVFFVDLNGDRKDDYLIVQRTGYTRAWSNNFVFGGDGTTWSPGFQIAGDVPGGPTGVFRWADLDGDRRADRIMITAGGGARAWLNKVDNPNNTNSVRLIDIGQILPDTGLPPAELRFIDIGGNGKADLLHINSRGVTHIWVNKVF